MMHGEAPDGLSPGPLVVESSALLPEIERGAGSSGAWEIERLRIADEQCLEARFRSAHNTDWIEVSVLRADAPGAVFHRFRHCVVRYRGRIADPQNAQRDGLRALVLGVGASVEARLARDPSATIAEAMGRRRDCRRVVFGRDALREMLAPDVVEGVPIAGGWVLADVYPSSQVGEADSRLLEMVLEFRRASDLRRVQFIVARRDEARSGFVSTAHLSVSYRSAGSEAPGLVTLRALVAFRLEVRDYEGLEMVFPDVASDVAPLLLGAPETPEPTSPSDEVLNLAISTECNQACAFCSVKELAPPEAGGDATLARCCADLEASFRRGVRRVRINGYDPLSYQRIQDVLRYATRLGYAHADVFSPCTLLADRSFCESVLASLPASRRFYVPLYAADAETHDHVVGRQGAFDLVMAALEHLVELEGPRAVSILSVATRDNVEQLAALWDFAQRREFSFSAHMPYPSFESEEDRYFSSVPRQTDVAAAFARAWSAHGTAAPFPVHGVAPCVTLRRMRAASVPAKRWLDASRPPQPLPGTEYRDARFRHGAGDRADSAYAATTIPCPHASKCTLLPACGGELLRSYVQSYGVDEVAAISLDELIQAT